MALGHRSTNRVFYWHQSDDETHDEAADSGRTVPAGRDHAGSTVRTARLMSTPRGFNMMSAIGNPFNAFYYHPSSLWRPGDFVLHRVNEPKGAMWDPEFELLFGSAAAALAPCPARWNVRADGSAAAAAREAGVAVGPAQPCGAHQPPCIDSVWSHHDGARGSGDGSGAGPRLLLPNLWDGYAAAVPREHPGGGPRVGTNANAAAIAASGEVVGAAATSAAAETLDVPLSLGARSSTGTSATATGGGAVAPRREMVLRLRAGDDPGSRLVDFVLGTGGFAPIDLYREAVQGEHVGFRATRDAVAAYAAAQGFGT